MANRVYVYGSNSIDSHFKGIIEHDYIIPYSIKILSGTKFLKFIKSPIFNDQIASVSDYQEGVKNLFRFFEKIKKETNDKYLIYDIKKSENFLNKRKYKFIIADFNEISAMSGGEKEIINISKNIQKECIEFSNRFKHNKIDVKKIVENYPKNEDEFGLSFSDILYYSI